MGMEEHAVILDYLPFGRVEDGKMSYKKEPVAYAVGEDYLTLIELVPKPSAEFKTHERVYIGKDQRDKVGYIKSRISYRNLSSAAKSELPYVIEEIVSRQEEKFVKFFNEAQPISTRLHNLELIPGIGKKLMWEILDERKKKPFASFKDIAERVKSLPDPKKLVCRRIVSELEEEEAKLGKKKYRLFAPPPLVRKSR